MQKIKEKIITGIKKIKIRTLISHLIITLAYPVLRATTADGKRLLIFTDALTVIALVATDKLFFVILVFPRRASPAFLLILNNLESLFDIVKLVNVAILI